MTFPTRPALLDVLLDSWDRNNTILTNLLYAVPEPAMKTRATENGPSVAQLFTHIHFVRLVLLSEDAAEFVDSLPDEEWSEEHDQGRIAAMLSASARSVRQAVAARIEGNRGMDRHYDHPVLLIQHLLWHEGYHHGQIKLALKLAGCPISDQEAGPLTWDIWMDRGQGQPPESA